MSEATTRLADDSTRTVEQSVPYWPLWIACFLGYAAIGATIQVMPDYARTILKTDAFASGLAVTIGSLATMVSRPLAGRFADKRGARGVVLTGAILGVLGGVGHLLASTYPVLILARLLLGAGEGALFTAAIGWVLADAAPERQGKVAGHFGMSMWAGLAGGPILGAALLAVSGFRTVWITASLLPLLAVAIVALTPRQARVMTTDRRRALLPRAAWLPAASIVFASIGYGVVAAFVVPRFATLNLAGKDVALAVFGIAFLVARFLGSTLVDRIGPRTVLVGTVLVEALGLGGIAMAQTTAPALISTAVAGAGLSLLYPCLAALVTRAAAAHERTAAIGAMTSAWDLGLAVGGPVGGLVAGVTYAGPFLVGALAALAGAIPMLLASRVGPRSHLLKRDDQTVDVLSRAPLRTCSKEIGPGGMDASQGPIIEPGRPAEQVAVERRVVVSVED